MLLLRMLLDEMMDKMWAGHRQQGEQRQHYTEGTETVCSLAPRPPPSLAAHIAMEIHR